MTPRSPSVDGVAGGWTGGRLRRTLGAGNSVHMGTEDQCGKLHHTVDRGDCSVTVSRGCVTAVTGSSSGCWMLGR